MNKRQGYREKGRDSRDSRVRERERERETEIVHIES